jgi:hypothetical protein
MKHADELDTAYRNTTYWVDAAPQPIAVRVGERNASLDRLLNAARARHYAFVTACNPRSKLRTHWYNEARQRALRRWLNARHLRWIPALAQGDRDDWPAEPGVLILGLPPDRALRIGRRFRQNAVLTGKLGNPPEVRWCMP